MPSKAGQTLPPYILLGPQARDITMAMYLYPDHAHPVGVSGRPWFRVKSDKLFPEVGHPEGHGIRSWYQIR